MELYCNGSSRHLVNNKKTTGMMLKPITVFALLVLLIGCSKEKFDYATFAGTWEKEKFTGFPGTIDYPPGNGDIIVLSANKTYEHRNGITVVYGGSYSIDKKQDCNKDYLDYFIHTDDPAMAGQNIISLQDGKLTLGSSACLADGGVTTYRRITE